jgi:DNA-binding winged helix-turn-helix (wHTH) protein
MGPSSALNSASDGVVCFGVFEDDLRSGELRKNGVKIKIQDLPFRALNLLLSRPNEIIRREEFRRALWPDGVFVDFDSGISNTIKRLRDALGDSADNPIFIETVDAAAIAGSPPCEAGTSPQKPDYNLMRSPTA